VFKDYLTSDDPADIVTDANVEEVRALLHKRAQVGFSKYGVTTERTDLSTIQWLKHAREEAMDHAVYLTRIIRDLEEMKDD
jgi:hypothetical protein